MKNFSEQLMKKLIYLLIDHSIDFAIYQSVNEDFRFDGRDLFRLNNGFKFILIYNESKKTETIFSLKSCLSHIDAFLRPE